MCHFNLTSFQVSIPSLVVALKMTAGISLEVQDRAELTSFANNSMYLYLFVLHVCMYVCMYVCFASGWLYIEGLKAD